jgi:hypothetical protein
MLSLVPPTVSPIVRIVTPTGPVSSPITPPTATETPVATATPIATTMPRPTSAPADSRSATDTAAAPSPTAKVEASSAPAGSLLGNIAFTVYNKGIGSYTLYMVKPDGSNLHAVADYVHQPDLSPDGKRIVVDGVGGDKNDLWSFKTDGSDWQQLTQHSDDHCPTWAPNGNAVAFSSTRQGDGVYRLYATSGQVSTPQSKFILGDYPVWLPNWEFVFSGCDYGWGAGTKCGLWHASSGNTPMQLTGEPRDIPTDGLGGEVLFLRPDDDNWDIYRVALGGDPIRLTDNSARDGPAAFSPDGKIVAFLSDRSGGWALYTMNRQGGEVRKQLDLPMGGSYDAGPYPWTSERISWGGVPAAATPMPTAADSGLLPAPQLVFPIPDDTVSPRKPTVVRWTWEQQLVANQGFEVRFWHTSESTALGVAPPTTQTELEVHLGLTEAYQSHGDNTNYYLDVVVVQLEPYKVLSKSAPHRVKMDPNK